MDSVLETLLECSRSPWLPRRRRASWWPKLAPWCCCWLVWDGEAVRWRRELGCIFGSKIFAAASNNIRLLGPARLEEAGDRIGEDRSCWFWALEGSNAAGGAWRRERKGRFGCCCCSGFRRGGAGLGILLVSTKCASSVAAPMMLLMCRGFLFLHGGAISSSSSSPASCFCSRYSWNDGCCCCFLVENGTPRGCFSLSNDFLESLKPASCRRSSCSNTGVMGGGDGNCCCRSFRSSSPWEEEFSAAVVLSGRNSSPMSRATTPGTTTRLLQLSSSSRDLQLLDSELLLCSFKLLSLLT